MKNCEINIWCRIIRQTRSVTLELKWPLSLIEFNTVVHYIGWVFKSRSKSIRNCNEMKLHKFCNNQVR